MRNWVTVSIPRGLSEDIQKLVDEVNYWPSISSFVRDACIAKIRYENDLRLRAGGPLV